MPVIEPTLEVERTLGASVVIGIDEVGRGAIAGPVAVGAVAIDVARAALVAGLRDSKLLSERRREEVAVLLAEWGIARAVGLASAGEVDEFGIVEALRRAGHRALRQLAPPPVDAIVLLDGSHDWLGAVGRRVVTRTKADRDCASVAAASVLAKVHRDALMIAADAEFPGYGWASNKGYGADAHFAAIRALGLTPLHRSTWIRDSTPGAQHLD